MFFPYGTDRQLSRIPWATISIIAANVLMAAVTWTHLDLLEVLSFSPEAFRWWQPLTALFCHAGPEHLIGNMLFLWLFGSHVEDVLGARRFILVYFTCGLAADLQQVFTDQLFYHEVRGGLGASGAIMGLVAFFATRLRHVKVRFLYAWYYRWGTAEVDALWVGIAYVALDVLAGGLTGLLGVHSGTGHFAHVGGFAAGIGWLYLLREDLAMMREIARAETKRLAACGAFSAAGAYLEGASTRWPTDAEVEDQIATYYAMADATREKAAPHWDRAIRMWLNGGHRDEAIAAWGRVRRAGLQEAMNRDTLFDMGVIMEESGQFEDAGKCYRHAIRANRSDPGTAPVALRLADMERATGNDAAARQLYEGIIRHWPESQQAMDARTRLQELARS